MIWKICFIWGFFVVVCDTSKVAKICKKREKLSWREEKEFSQWPPQWTYYGRADGFEVRIAAMDLI